MPAWRRPITCRRRSSCAAAGSLRMSTCFMPPTWGDPTCPQDRSNRINKSPTAPAPAHSPEAAISSIGNHRVRQPLVGPSEKHMQRHFPFWGWLLLIITMLYAIYNPFGLCIVGLWLWGEEVALPVKLLATAVPLVLFGLYAYGTWRGIG